MKKTTTIFLFILMVSVTIAKAQLVYNEGFGAAGPYPAINLPFGWTQGKWGAGTDPQNYFDRVNVGTNPIATPRSAPSMLRYRSFDVFNGEASFIATKVFDMRAIPAGGAPFSFWMFRDNGFAPNADRIQVYVNTSPTPTGATLLTETVSLSNVVHRYCLSTPNAGLCGGWNQYSYLVPNTFNGASVYIILIATSADGNNIFIDDFSITSYPLAQTYVAGSAQAYGPNINTTSQSAQNQHIIGCKITVSGALSPLTVSNFLFNTNGSTNPVTDISNADLWFSGADPAFDPLTAIPLSGYPNPHFTNIPFAGSWTNLEHGDNYFWLTYDISATGVSGNFVDAEFLSVTIGGVPVVPVPQTLGGNREIDLVYCIAPYVIGTSWNNYTNNDYVHNVTMVGDNIPAPGIGNSQNWILAPAGPSCPMPVPRNCPFQSHLPDYEFFAQVPGKTTSVTADGTTNYPISLQVGTFGFGNTIAAWIDYNKDGIFQNTEKIAQSGFLGALGVYNTTFTVPVAAIAGKTRMRVREAWINNNIDPCNLEFFGEVEDYTITIVPDCPGLGGWTTWLGFTDDWTDPSNWCPAVPPMTPFPLSNVRIPGGPSSAGYTYIRPVIRTGVQARALQLNVEQDDTIYIDAPSASSLNVNEELRIVGSQSAIVVNSQFTGEAEVLNGQLTGSTPGLNNNMTPFRNVPKSRSFLVISQAEMLSQGMLAGDIVNTIKIPLQRNSSNPTYQNFQMKYWYTNNAFVFTPGNPALILPPVVGAPFPAAVIRASGPLSVAGIPAGTWDTLTIPLTTPFAWTGTTNQLVIEMSYDLSATGINDQPRYTQTTGLRKYLSLVIPGPAPTYVASTIQPPTTTTLMSGGAVPAGTLIAVGNSAILAVGMTVTGTNIPAGTVVTSVGPGNFITLSNNTTGALSGNGTFGNNVFVSSVNSDHRPNLVFAFSRPYVLYPIAVGKDWINNGNFFPGLSRVTFNGTAQQLITGTDSTTFYDLTIANNAHVMLNADAGVTNNLLLQSGRFKLNNRLLTLTNQASTALSRVGGYIQSEQDVIANNVAPFGRLRWDMGSVVGPRTIYYANTANSPLYLTYDLVAGTHDVTLATYATAPTNLNLPPPVTNIFGFNGSVWNADGSSTVDRYYLIDKPSAGTVNLTFRYANTERSQNNSLGVFNMSAQRWMDATSLWEFPFLPGQLYSSGAPDQVYVPNFTGFASNKWWTIVGTSTPLPITLLDFASTSYSNRVKLHWTTATELNNSHFEVYRTLNHIDFDYIGKLDGHGSTTRSEKYELWDMDPLEGIQYYYLHQYDFDGRVEKYGPVSATFSHDLFDIITTTVGADAQGVNIVFSYDSNEPYQYKIIDVTGRVIASNENNDAAPGVNELYIPASLSKGIYQVILQNSSKTVSRKILY